MKVGAALKQYIALQNTQRTIFNRLPPISVEDPTQTDLKEIAECLEADLSPENLTCDGELSGPRLHRKAKHLHAVRTDLEAVGVKLPY